MLRLWIDNTNHGLFETEEAATSYLDEHCGPWDDMDIAIEPVVQCPGYKCGDWLPPEELTFTENEKVRVCGVCEKRVCNAYEYLAELRSYRC